MAYIANSTWCFTFWLLSLLLIKFIRDITMKEICIDDLVVDIAQWRLVGDDDGGRGD